MIKRTAVCIFIALLCYRLTAQSIITGVVIDSLNHPIPGVSVYLSKTTIGNPTDKNGSYTLSVPQSGVYELTASCIGYKTNSQIIHADTRKLTINIRLSANLIMLDEITVKSREKDRLTNYRLFTKLFLGEDDNASGCKIINTEDLHFYRDPDNNYLKAFSINPLIIQNRLLGYTITYDIVEFYYNIKTGLLRFSGHDYFQKLKGSSSLNKKWNRNRLAAYYGSRTHFFRALYSDSLERENYEVATFSYDSVEKQITNVTPFQSTTPSKLKKNGYFIIYSKSPLLIIYTDNHSELSGSLTGFQSQKRTSVLNFSDTIKIYKNGYYDNPYSVTWEGAMSEERLSNMLPDDFLFNAGVKVVPYADSFTSTIENYVNYEQKDIPSDQVFVHTDKNLYKPGDTIHFEAYIRDRVTGLFESPSASLYVILFNEKRDIADSSRFKIENSTSPGWIKIPSDAEQGKYHLVSFTGTMQNFDPEYAFQTDLSVKINEHNNLQIQLEFDKKNYRPGDTLEANIIISNLKDEPEKSQKFQYALISGNRPVISDETRTNMNGESDIQLVLPDTISSFSRIQIITHKTSGKPSTKKDFNIPLEDSYFELKFLPEGGTLVNGLEQRIGFNATNSKGESLFIEGLLKNSKGVTQDTIRSGPYGAGLFVCTAESGMYVELINGFHDKKIWPLPDPVTNGISMSVRPSGRRSFYVDVQSDHYTGEKAYVYCNLNTYQIFSQELRMEKKQRITVETDQLPSGVIQIILFNKDLKPVAERLFFINSDKHLNFTIKTNKSLNVPDSETELTVSASDGEGYPVKGLFSISVVDSLTGNDSGLFMPGIEYVFNYHPFLASNIPAKALTEGLENLKSEDCDLLFMVYGWSRFKRDSLVNYKPENEQVNYELLKMKILYVSESHRADRRLDLYSLEGPSVTHLLTNSLGEVSIKLDSLPQETRSVTLMPNTENKKRVMGAMLSIPYNEKYFKSNKLFVAQHTIPQTNKIRTSVDYKYLPGDSVIEIPEVIIKGEPRAEKIYHDIYEKTYQYANIRSLDYDQLWASNTFEDALYRLTFAEISPNGVYFRASTSVIGPHVPALIVFNGLPLGTDGYNFIKTIPPYEMTSLTILKGKQGFARYGEAAIGGIIFVNTLSVDPKLMKIKTDWRLQHTDNKMLLPIKIFRKDIEFYTPTRFEKDNDPVFKNYSTVYWNPEVYLDGENSVKLKFTNLNHKGQIKILINGASFNGLYGTGRAGYYVSGL